LRITVDAEIEQWLDTHAVVISSSACACNDELLVHCLEDGGQITFCTARVLSCEPILGNPTRYRINLSFTPARAPAHLDGVPVA
jgi:hypothetical protein